MISPDVDFLMKPYKRQDLQSQVQRHVPPRPTQRGLSFGG